MIRHLAAIASTAGLAVLLAASPPTQQATSGRSLIEHEAAMAVQQPGPHEGGGTTTAFPFFAKAAPDFKMAFRKRILHKGSAIGYHRQDVDEVYYIISGTGDYTLNGKTQSVGPGTAMLTRPGDSHGLRPTGDADLVIIITYSTQGS